MNRSRRRWVGSLVLLGVLAGTGLLLAGWKRAALAADELAAASQPEPVEAVTLAVAREREYLRTTTSIGTVLALRSVTLRNELPGTVREVRLRPGSLVEQGELLVALDVAVEEAELRAEQAQAALTEAMLVRMRSATERRAASQTEVDRALAERDVALARIARSRAIIERKTLRAPFRARVGLADVHPGQYLAEGTELTTLQGVDDAVHVDFSVVQEVAAGLAAGGSVQVVAAAGAEPVSATIVALDARLDVATRNATVRARIDGVAGTAAPAPGASVRVLVPVGGPATAVVVPVSALRKSPAGDHVFVIAPDAEGRPRAQQRTVVSGTVLGDDVVIHAGLQAGEPVAITGSFKLHDAALVSVTAPAAAPAHPGAPVIPEAPPAAGDVR